MSIDWPEDVLTRLLASAPELRLVRRGQEQRKGERVFGIDFSAALKEAIGRTLGAITLNTAQLGGRTLTPGLYKSPSTAFDLTGTLTLAGKGVYIFQMTAGAAGLTVANNASVSLTKGAKAEDVFWAVSSGATLGTYSVFVGTIMAYTESITMATGATLNGRALDYLAAVTCDDNVVTLPTAQGQGGQGGQGEGGHGGQGGQGGQGGHGEGGQGGQGEGGQGGHH